MTGEIDLQVLSPQNGEVQSNRQRTILFSQIVTTVCWSSTINDIGNLKALHADIGASQMSIFVGSIWDWNRV